MSYKRILIISQMFLFNSMFSQGNVKNNEILGKERSVNPTDVELQRISQEVNEINKNFEIIKLKQEKKIKSNAYKNVVKNSKELEDLNVKLSNLSQELEKQTLKNDIANKQEELSEKSNITKNNKEKEKLKSIQEQKELIDELSIKLQILTLKVSIMQKENELSNLSNYKKDELDDYLKHDKNVKKMDIENRELELKIAIKNNELKLKELESLNKEEIKDYVQKQKEIKSKNIEIEKLNADETLENLKKRNEAKFKKNEKLIRENMQQAEVFKSEAAILSAKLDLLIAQQNDNLTKNEELIRMKLDTEILKNKNEYLMKQIEYLNNKDTLFNKIQEGRDNLSFNPVQYLKNPLTKDGVLILSDRQIKFGLIVNDEEARKAEYLIDFYNNDTEHKGYPIFLIFEDGCYGGRCDSMQSIVNKISNSESPVYVVVKKFAYSAAAVITTCAAKSFIYEEAEMMHHQCQIRFGFGRSFNPTELKEYAEYFWNGECIYNKKLCAKLGCTPEKFVKKMYENSCNGEGWFLFGEKAKKEKWVDHVIKSCRDTSILSKNKKEKKDIFDLLFLKQQIEQDMKIGKIWYIDDRILK